MISAHHLHSTCGHETGATPRASKLWRPGPGQQEVSHQKDGKEMVEICEKWDGTSAQSHVFPVLSRVYK